MPSRWRARAAEVLPAREQRRASESEARRGAVRPPVNHWASRSTCRTGSRAASSTICGKSRLVAATSRPFTRIVREPPTRSNACSCSTRSTMGYTWSPPWARATSKQPRRSDDGGRRAREEATGSSAAQKTLAKLKGRLDSKELLPPEVREAGDLIEQARIMTIRLDQALFAIREPQAGDIGERVDMLSEERRPALRVFPLPKLPGVRVHHGKL